MIKVQYPSNLDALKQKYLASFCNLDQMKRRWAPIEKRYNVSLPQILTADFSTLVDYYYQYKRIAVGIKSKTEKVLKDIFDYDKYQPKLAAFFMDPANGFHISTCHYCNTAYINAYGKNNSYDSILDFINRATETDWRHWFDEKELPDTNIQKILDDKPFASIQDFNTRRKKNDKYLHQRIELYDCMKLVADSNHFDLDHLLPKSKCPILALSLFNFVPSCQVCNEKLKGNIELANTKKDWLKISPTYENSNMSEEVIFRLVPKSSCSTFFELDKNHSNYHLRIDTMGEKVYDEYVTTFRLHDRYSYHKSHALQILDLKERYGEEKRKEISRLLSAKYDAEGKGFYTESQVLEDILQETFSEGRCFAKLRHDMIHHN